MSCTRNEKGRRARGDKPYLVLLTMLLLGSISLHANDDYSSFTSFEEVEVMQKKEVRGVVLDEDNIPLPGVNVVVVGTDSGTTTDFEGSFSIGVPDSDAVLEFSFIGFQSQQITVGNKSEITVTLKEDASQLSEVVVVGYGRERKADLTGSVATINSDDLDSRPVTNVSSSLAGLAPGLQVQQSSGDPRSDGASIRIRGTGTLNDSSPLIIVDGMPGTMDDVNPSDVESISVLKDAASASIYGARAANGVILITTKQGKKGEPQVRYSGQFSFAEPLNFPKFVTDYPTHMRLVNEGQENLNQSTNFSQSTIDAWEEAKQNPNGLTEEGIPNYIAYPNTDWGNEIFERNLVQKHNISVNGSGEKARYFLSAGYLDNPGTMAKTQKERYDLRANVSVDIGDHLTVGTQTFASMDSQGKGNTSSAFNFLRQTTPGVVPKYNGEYGTAQAPGESGTANNILRFLEENRGEDKAERINTTLFATVKIIDGLTLDSKINYKTWNREQSTSPNPSATWNFLTNEIVSPEGSPKDMGTSRSLNKNRQITINHVLNYGKVFAEKHDVAAFVGYEEFYSKSHNWSAGMRGLIDPTITTLGSASEMNSISGGASDYSTRSVFGRVNYAFDGRYLLQANVRYDGSSRFDSSRRWGVFPSVSAGWRISKENFFQDLDWNVQDLKLRASWGKLGNSSIGNYDYQATYSAVNYTFNDVVANGLRQSKLPNPDLRWEETKVLDLGFDLTVLDGRLTAGFDLYDKQTDGILTSPPIHLTMGTVSAPTRNTAGVNNRGIELELGWRDQIGDFQYFVNANFAYNKNKVTDYKGKLEEGFVTNEDGEEEYQTNLGDVSSGGLQRILEGHAINEYYAHTLYKGDGSYTNSDGSINPNGGPRDGMIRTDEDYQWVQDMQDAGYTFMPTQNTGKTQIYKGDFIYADNNGDGVYGNTTDQQFLGVSSTPKYNYGLSAGASWKGIDFSMLWTGSAGMKYYYLDGQGGHSNITRNGFSLLQKVADNHYYFNDDDPKDPANNINGKYPRLKNNSDNQNDIASDFWLYDASYIKLKNIQVGYTFPKNWINKIWMNNARVYVSAENLLMITDYPGVDPEVGSGFVYPSMRQITFGVDLTF